MRMSGALLLLMRVETTVYTSFQETTSRFSLMPGFASSNFLTKLVPFMPVPVNQSFVWVPYWQMMTSSVISSAIPMAAQEISITSASIRVANFFMRYPAYIGQRPFVKFIINDTSKIVKNVLIFFHLLFILSFLSAFRPVFHPNCLNNQFVRNSCASRASAL